MKTVKQFVVLSALFVFLSAVSVLALTPQEQRRLMLASQRSDAHQLVIEACQDQKITSAEMENIRKAVENFQKEYSEAVSIYGGDMGDKIDERLEKTVDFYYHSHPLKQGRSCQPQMKRLLSDFSGQDILTIETTLSRDHFRLFVLWILFGLILVFVGAALDSDIFGVAGVLVAVVGFLIMALLIII